MAAFHRCPRRFDRGRSNRGRTVSSGIGRSRPSARRAVARPRNVAAPPPTLGFDNIRILQRRVGGEGLRAEGRCRALDRPAPDTEPTGAPVAARSRETPPLPNCDSTGRCQGRCRSGTRARAASGTTSSVSGHVLPFQLDSNCPHCPGCCSAEERNSRRATRKPGSLVWRRARPNEPIGLGRLSVGPRRRHLDAGCEENAGGGRLVRSEWPYASRGLGRSCRDAPAV